MRSMGLTARRVPPRNPSVDRHRLPYLSGPWNAAGAAWPAGRRVGRLTGEVFRTKLEQWTSAQILEIARRMEARDERGFSVRHPTTRLVVEALRSHAREVAILASALPPPYH